MEKFNKNDISRLRKLIDDADNIVITGHMTPDGDAIGSTVGLMHVLDAMGKRPKVVVPDQVTNQLSFLAKGADVVVYSRKKEFADLLFSNADLILCLDYNAPKRVDRMAQALTMATAPKVLIDHHEEPEYFCDITISRPEASSTCMLLFKVLCALELVDAIDEKAATCILAGMMTDTGNFSFSNSEDPEIYEVVAELIRRGASKTRLTKLLFDTYSADCLKLNAYAIGKKMRLWPDKGAALITLTRDELNMHHYKPGYTEGLVNKPLAIPEVVYSVYLREEERYVKVSMRSEGDFNCKEVCEKYFNGGGHINAAGGEFYGTMQKAVQTLEGILDENFEKYIKKHK
ncbi:MAG: DHH family phosphoesterase [Clostridium sp.]|nr:DHH family phosphoesterase [Clostridium sp.]